MALYHINFFSQCLGGQTELYAVIPNDVPAFALENNPQLLLQIQ